MLRVRVVGSGWSGGPSLNTFYFQDVAMQQDEAQLCVDRVHTAFDDTGELYPNAVVHQVQPEVDVISPETGEITDTLVATLPTPLPGGAPDAGMIAPATALLLQLRTGTFANGRRLRGRAFLSPLAYLMQSSDGTPSPNALIWGNAFGAALLDEGVVGPRLVVWSRPRVADPDATPPVTARVGYTGLVTSITVPDRFAVLRSRRP